jgi:hypothetical protein
MRWLFPVVFFVVLVGHFLYATRSPSSAGDDSAWATYKFDIPETSRFDRYTQPGEYWIGLSYGLAGAFASFCLYRAVKRRRESLAESAGGLALSGLLWASFCFFAGCCGSPMLPVYLGLLGPNFLGVTKPLTFGLTVLSISVGYVVILKRDGKSCGEVTEGNHVNARLHEDAGANPG